MEDLVKEALEVYGIPEEHILGSGTRKFEEKIFGKWNDVIGLRLVEEAVIVTHGGKKIRHRKGEPAKAKLTEVEITGVLSKAPEGEPDRVWLPRLGQWLDMRELDGAKKRRS